MEPDLPVNPSLIRLRALLRLVRAQNLLTAVADSWAGLIVAAAGSTSTARWHEFGRLALVSAGMYAAGAVLNDLADLDIDRVAHPDRALPSGVVRPRTAFVLAVSLLVVALVAAASLGMSTMIVAATVGAIVVAYDFAAKKVRVAGAVTMALARFGNFSLGLAAMGSAFPKLSGPGLALPLLVALHVFIVTLVSYFEDLRDSAGGSGEVAPGRMSGARRGLLGMRGGFLCLLLGCDAACIGLVRFALPTNFAATLALAMVLLFVGVAGIRLIAAMSASVPHRAAAGYVVAGVQAVAGIDAAIAAAFGGASVAVAMLVFFVVGILTSEALKGA
ncbi:MAG: UbiA family prenyltransferase [Planctomycetota bacterium]|nr:UbiA family prenyltransferase [Planctomycetota bacterium]